MTLKSITITKRTLTITPAGEKPSKPSAACSPRSQVQLPVSRAPTAATQTYASPGAPAAAAVGKYNITSSFAFTSGSATNYNVQAGTAVEGLWVQDLQDGSSSRSHDTADDQHEASLISKFFKLGQTIPVKFDLKDANGNIVVQAGSPLFKTAHWSQRAAPSRQRMSRRVYRSQPIQCRSTRSMAATISTAGAPRGSRQVCIASTRTWRTGPLSRC